MVKGQQLVRVQLGHAYRLCNIFSASVGKGSLFEDYNFTMLLKKRQVMDTRTPTTEEVRQSHSQGSSTYQPALGQSTLHLSGPGANLVFGNHLQYFFSPFISHPFLVFVHVCL